MKAEIKKNGTTLGTIEAPELSNDAPNLRLLDSEGAVLGTLRTQMGYTVNVIPDTPTDAEPPAGAVKNATPGSNLPARDPRVFGKQDEHEK